MENDDLLKKWLSDDLTAEERSAFEAMEDAGFYKEIVADAAQFEASNFSKVESFEHFKTKVMVSEPEDTKLRWLAPMLKIASVLVLLFGLYYFFLFNAGIEIQTLAAEKTTIELPDTSIIEVNALSEVSYNEKEWETNRQITLEGEAFFDVAKGAKFDVITTKGTVSVLGTEFNVKQRGNYFEVACFEGTVRVVSGTETTILNAGDNFTSIDGAIASGKNNFEVPQWTNNTSYFQRVPIKEIFDELERQYDITVELQDVDTSGLFTGGFTHDNLENALASISEPLGLTHEILKRDKVRFSKREK